MMEIFVNRKEKYKNIAPKVSFANEPTRVPKKWEDVDQWATTVYVTNLPPLVTKKGVMDQCSKVGSVIDVYMPMRPAVTGKKFAFVRFVRGSDVSNLIYRIRNLWIGNFRLYADVARFKRGSKPRVENDHKNNKDDGDIREVRNQKGVNGAKLDEGNYVWKKKEAVVINVGNKEAANNLIPKTSVNVKVAEPNIGSKPVSGKEVSTSSSEVLKKDGMPAMGEVGTGSLVVDIGSIPEDMIVGGEEFSSSLCLKVNNIFSMRNLPQLVLNEGFEDVGFRYLGGLWVRVDCGSKAECTKFSNCEGLRPIFHSCLRPRSDFVIKERVIWVEVRGLPLCTWNNAVLHHIAKHWGEPLFGEDDIEEPLSCGKVCILTSRLSRIQEEACVMVQGKKYKIEVVEVQSWSPCFDRGGGAETDSEEDEDEVELSDEDNVSLENEVQDREEENIKVSAQSEEVNSSTDDNKEANYCVDGSDPCNMKAFLENFELGKTVSLSLSVPPGYERIIKRDEEEVSKNSRNVSGSYANYCAPLGGDGPGLNTSYGAGLDNLDYNQRNCDNNSLHMEEMGSGYVAAGGAGLGKFGRPPFDQKPLEDNVLDSEDL
ncbi:hypothetical protein SSX86_022754 [Deinandra increscens subsp. villosa]|uniref:RRM domain-containing protein n=1 Tax=Deinandra increscens subsp. villosa TaxID=3103831 RepID=A0AAP0GST0_9ASTR